MHNGYKNYPCVSFFAEMCLYVDEREGKKSGVTLSSIPSGDNLFHAIFRLYGLKIAFKHETFCHRWF